MERQSRAQFHCDRKQHHDKTEKFCRCVIKVVLGLGLGLRLWLRVVEDYDGLCALHLLGEQVAAIDRQKHKARERGNTCRRGQQLEELPGIPLFDELFYPERSDNGDPKTIEIALPADSKGIKAEEREDERGHSKDDGDSPVVSSLPPAAAEITRRRSVPQPLREILFFFEQERSFLSKSENPRLIGEFDPLLFIRAVGFGLAHHTAQACNSELLANAFRV